MPKTIYSLMNGEVGFCRQCDRTLCRMSPAEICCSLGTLITKPESKIPMPHALKRKRRAKYPYGCSIVIAVTFRIEQDKHAGSKADILSQLETIVCL